MTSPRGLHRRQFIRLGLAGSALMPSLLLGNGKSMPALRWLQVRDDWAAPAAGRNDWLAVDTGVQDFSGDGLYLYPGWGDPRPYLVREVAAVAGGFPLQLEFCNPGTGRVLWTDSGRPGFAGRIHGRLPGQISAWLGHMPALDLLHLPRLPA